ncbi:restriction endonuclease subunit S [Bacillus altitudinis]|uniref:restriction endonuclease subunit S n=1 Tax=Bacillus altitudinis TaxID=293387 RepID=UPI0011AA230C|nr:restriction endonuclease subunit S [Bacillus altitudinis]
MSKNKETIDELLEEVLLPEDGQTHEVPANWIWVKSEFVAKWGSGGTPSRKNSEYYNGNIPWLKTGELRDTVILDSEEKITEEGLKKSSAKLFPKDSVAIAMYGATIGKLGILGIDAATNQACAVGVPYAFTDKKFMFYYFLTQRKNLIDKGKGGAQPNISQTIIKEFPYILPPINEQKRIADKVENLLNKIEEAKQLIEEAKKSFELRRSAILEKAFSGALLSSKFNKITKKINEQITLEIPTHWKIKTLSEVVQNYNNQRIPVSQKKREEMKGDIPYYGATGIVDFVDGYTHKGEFICIGEDGANLLSRSKPQAFIIRGKSWVNNHAHVVKMNDNMCNNYLMHYINFIPLNDYVTGTAQPKLNRKNLDKIPIVLPPVNEQFAISQKIEDLLLKEIEMVNVCKSNLHGIDIIKQSIMNKAFRGELGTNDPNEENMIELLKEVLQEQVK